MKNRLKKLLACLWGVAGMICPLSAKEDFQYVLERDWMRQDAEKLDVSHCFTASEGNAWEYRMVEKVLQELSAKEPFQETLRSLKEVPGKDARWKELYRQACKARRIQRLRPLLEKTSQLIYCQHCPIGAAGNIAGNHFPTDRRRPPHRQDTSQPLHKTWKKGSQLRLLTIAKDGSVHEDILAETPEGFIRDPALSWDGKKVLVARRDSFLTDDYQIYELDLTSRQWHPITCSLEKDGKVYPISCVEPCYLPSGRIIFQSTRCAQLDPCGWDVSGNLYSCEPDGSGVRRLGFDQVTTMFPQVLDDGRILYTRWEYNDRTPIFIQPLFVMNEDGTGQTAFYGNNSWFPVSLLHARGVPGSTLVMAIASGHHTLQKGKLVLVDRSRGTDGDVGITFLGEPFSSPLTQAKEKSTELDGFGQGGGQFAYPYPLDERYFLVSFTPDGYQGHVNYAEHLYPNTTGQPFGVYWMDASGRRELLAFDSENCCMQAIPVMARPIPPVRSSQINENVTTGTFYVQNIYLGPGLKGVPQGTIRKLRVVALEYRAAWAGSNNNHGEGGGSCVQTPIGGNNACWDVKHVLGEVDVEEDGSAFWEVPARTPVYFQMLDEKGRCVQTMRSWTMLMPGENFACLGCHEPSSQVGPAMQSQGTLAMKKPPQKLQPVDGRPHPLLLRKPNAPLSVEDYLGIQRPRKMDPDAPVEGFSFLQKIQPILDKHCVHCHSEQGNGEHRSDFCLTSERVRDERAQRLFTRSYLQLTNHGKEGKWIFWIQPESRPTLLPPWHTGSTRSKLMDYLEPTHYEVQVSEQEKKTVACWIDLGVPFCGAYPEAHLWNEEQKAAYDFAQQKRLLYAEQEDYQ
ncbi:MAG: hypothetical protein Q4D62_01505 [Planctomycetia bacterium]|nr:hypothetical protein [Planctomycetia bacterium]